MKVRLAVLMAFLVSGFTHAEGADNKYLRESEAAQLQREKAQHIWNGSCAYCHNDVHVAPALLGRRLPAPLTQSIVRNGAVGMPVYRRSELTDAELTELAEWIETSEATGTKMSDDE